MHIATKALKQMFYCKSQDLPFCRQSLSIEGFGCDIILNTHFSQKVFSASKPASICTQGLLPAVRCPPYCLSKTFGLLEEFRTTEDSAKQVNEENCALFPIYIQIVTSTFKPKPLYYHKWGVCQYLLPYYWFTLYDLFILNWHTITAVQQSLSYIFL